MIPKIKRPKSAVVQEPLTTWQQLFGHHCAICGRWMGRSIHRAHAACTKNFCTYGVADSALTDKEVISAGARFIRMFFDGELQDIKRWDYRIEGHWLAVATQLEHISTEEK